MNGNKVPLDTNIIIYLSKKLVKPESVFENNAIYAISVITKMELLGYQFTSKLEEQQIISILNSFIVVPLSEEIVALTIALRKTNKIKLPDAIIYATAQHLNAKLLTNNISDFNQIKGEVQLANPLNQINK